MKVGIYIYDQAEVLDFSGPYEVFTTANRVAEETKFETCLIAQHNGVVNARASYQVLPHHDFNSHPDLDVLIIVGGYHLDELDKPEVIEWIQKQADKAQLTGSVCTGAFLLAKAGVITNQKVTTHWEDIADLKTMFPELEVMENVRWVDEGNRITSGGISAGIDMALHLVSKLASKELAINTARQMEFDWSQTSAP